MGLYHNITYWDFDLDIGEGEHVAWLSYPFGEYVLDPICKVLYKYDDFSADLEIFSKGEVNIDK